MLEKYEEETDCLLYRIKAYSNPFRGMYISIVHCGDCEPVNFGKQIESLHEFQHALRLCGIEKKIAPPIDRWDGKTEKENNHQKHNNHE